MARAQESASLPLDPYLGPEQLDPTPYSLQPSHIATLRAKAAAILATRLGASTLCFPVMHGDTAALTVVASTSACPTLQSSGTSAMATFVKSLTMFVPELWADAVKWRTVDLRTPTN